MPSRREKGSTLACYRCKFRKRKSRSRRKIHHRHGCPPHYLWTIDRRLILQIKLFFSTNGTDRKKRAKSQNYPWQATHEVLRISTGSRLGEGLLGLGWTRSQKSGTADKPNLVERGEPGKFLPIITSHNPRLQHPIVECKSCSRGVFAWRTGSTGFR